MCDVILIKLGGSLITDKTKPYTPRVEVIRRLAKEIHNARIKSNLRVVVGHGGGSYPHLPAKEYHTQDGIINEKSYEGIAKVQHAAATLNRLVVRELIAAKENAMSIQLSSCSIAKNGKIFYMYLEPVKLLLKYNMVPVPYGDVGLDLEKGCTILSTEEVLRYIGENLHKIEPEFTPKKIIIAGEVDGVFTGDPHKDKNAKLIPEINADNIDEVGKYLAGSSGIDVTGGMKHKVEKMYELAKKGIEVHIINGLVPGNLEKAILGEKIVETVIRV